MDSVEITFKSVKYQQIDWNGQTILVKNSLSVSDQISLINAYIDDYFFTGIEDNFIRRLNFAYIEAEIRLIFGILKLATNIKVTDDDDIVLIGMDELSESGLWETIRPLIKNYADFRAKLDYCVAEIKDQFHGQNSVENGIKRLLSASENYINKLQDVDLSPENMEKIKKLSEEILGNVEKSPIADVLADKSRKTATRKKTTK